MNYHARINPHSIHSTGPQRVADLKARLEAERKVHRESPLNSYNRNIAERNIADLEPLLEQAEANEAARAQNARERQAEQDAKTAARQEADEAALRETVRLQFFAGNPTATAADFDRLYPSLKDQHLIDQARDALARTKASIGRLF
jgi:hypothetical protein